MSSGDRYREWAAANKEHLREYRKQYYAAHREKALRDAKEWSSQNPERSKASKQRHADANKEYNRERAKKLRVEHPEKAAAATARWRAQNAERKTEINKQWKAENRHKVRESRAARRLCEDRARPSWANVDAMRSIYAAIRPGEHVDHIVPLRSKLVCGLHCEANLRVIGAAENLRKNNRVWPDRP